MTKAYIVHIAWQHTKHCIEIPSVHLLRLHSIPMQGIYFRPMQIPFVAHISFPCTHFGGGGLTFQAWLQFLDLRTAAMWTLDSHVHCCNVSELHFVAICWFSILSADKPSLRDQKTGRGNDNHRGIALYRIRWICKPGNSDQPGESESNLREKIHQSKS